MSSESSLSSTAATDNPALLILSSKGFDIRVNCYHSKRGKPSCVFLAERAGRRFAGDSGAELLGLVTIWEHFGEAWNRQEPDILAQVVSNDLDGEDEDENEV